MIPVIDRDPPVGDCIIYRKRRFFISSPRHGLENIGYPELKTAIHYAENWRRTRKYISIVVKSHKNGKNVFFVFAALTKKEQRKDK